MNQTDKGFLVGSITVCILAGLVLSIWGKFTLNDPLETAGTIIFLIGIAIAVGIMIKNH